MTHEEYKEQQKEKWLKENSPKSQLLGNNILPMCIGFFLTVEGLKISQDIFNEEFDQISKSYFSVMKKLDEYYKKSYNNKLVNNCIHGFDAKSHYCFECENEDSCNIK